MAGEDRGQGAERVARLVLLTGYALAVAGLFAWLVLGYALVGVALLLAGLGDIVAGKVVSARAASAGPRGGRPA